MKSTYQRSGVKERVNLPKQDVEVMKITENSKKVKEFEDQYPKLTRATDDDVLIYAIETINGYIRIFIDVSEDVKTTDLRNAIPDALEWRDKLMEFQGRTGLISGNYLLVKWAKEHENNIRKPQELRHATYFQIAEAINQKIAEWLFEYVGKENIPHSKPSKYSKLLELDFYGIEDRIPDALERATRILKVCRMKDAEIRENLEGGLNQINSGYYPFEEEYPLSKQKFRKALEWSRMK